MILLAIAALFAVVLYFLTPILLEIATTSPVDVSSWFAWVAPYLARGVQFVNFWINPVVWQPLFAFTVSYTTILHSYRFAMWVAKKIPMFGVSD